jgi:predicted RNA-binding protein
MDFIYTAKDNKPTSQKALETLTKELQDLTKNLPDSNYYPDQDLLHALADYHFGKGIGKEFFTKCKIKGKPYLPQRIFKDKEQLGVIQPTSGKLLLSMKTGEILAKKNIYYIKTDTEKLEGSTLFAVAVTDVDEKIRPSDDIVILSSKGELLAVGWALMAGRDIIKQKRGSVAKIRNKK